MVKKNTFLNMKYNTVTNELIMTSETLRLWLNTYSNLSTEQKNQFLKELYEITRKEK